MAFFKKLKDRMFKSSSKIDEGLEAIVEDGGEVSAAEPELPQPSDPTPAPEPAPTPEPEQVPAPAPEEVPEPDLPSDPIPAPDPAPTPEPTPIPAPQPDLPPEPTPEIPQTPEPQPTPEPDPVPAPEPDLPPSPTPGPGPATMAVDTLMETPAAATAELPRAADPGQHEADNRPASGGLLNRLFKRSPAAQPVVRRVLDDDMLEQLEELLISTDMGVDTALRVTANMAEGRMGRKLSVGEIKNLMATEIARIMEPVARPLPIYPKTPQVVLVVGVNGSGKTTTIGKLASQFRAAGKNVVIAAGDTFRAAAVEQLQVWGERAGVPVMTAPEGSDPASLAFEAMTKAQQDGADLLMIDTAGRLQNRADLMEELAKIVRVIRKKDPSAPHNTLLVLDATTGQNALNQVKIFQEVADVSGLVMTKLDGTAKGGVLVALADKFGLPIHAIGVGEQIDDLDAFDPEDFARALTGADV
ncbi:signal recognition particle-docking protein FtsY [Pseudosulfitobacter pseudonitzschiae]|uniref:signal recognition particle-docking protein FtsY n=1 Tax=Pseudosulfitobacter pseudonitzschiae TaxID=1402135 RepID=UPI001AF1E581|nr:signal recognition particle-docking protein FtsY [Pseudosulfitobacter pseudonitzschiae]MBM1813730.1 signal recognition particle-docking protein FtsY [Pseudosulfitobacter pseudonitzschiae]MBM1830723.1 signal recognition particle-docking protein FtsY [Pseudosulfitobacter pseudonitzschiae]MBM1835590.1 signal recognition particle-docking protein FtsY [Pseudosulfitobacter pseudonitzschiae]MBM1840436.1 signal recognition particle-docking protein FtsY [Pseudosulfitobacter pseudonitzschiae]MBM18455